MTAQSPLLFLTPPRDFGATLALGTAGATSRNVTVVLESSDVYTGHSNVADMLVWGDIDPNFRPEVFASSMGGANWQPFEGAVELVLSAGDGEKTVYAKLRNAAGRETEVIENVLTLASEPHVSVLWTDERRQLAVDGVLRFGWSASHDFDEWEVVLSPSLDATYEQSRLLTNGDGSTAGTHHWASIPVEDIIAADTQPTQDGVKWIRPMIVINGVYFGGPGEPTVVPTPLVWDEGNWDEGSWA